MRIGENRPSRAAPANARPGERGIPGWTSDAATAIFENNSVRIRTILDGSVMIIIAYLP